MTYDAATRTATLSPTAAARASADVHRDRHGRRGGIKDVAGNALAADVAWSLHRPRPAACPCTHLDAVGDAGDRRPQRRGSGRARRQVPRRRGRLRSPASASTRAPATPAPTPAACGRAPARCSRRPRSPTRPRRAGSRSASARRSPIDRQHDLRRLVPRAQRPLRRRPAATSSAGVDNGPLHALRNGATAATASTATAPRRLPDLSFSAEQLLGRRRLYQGAVRSVSRLRATALAAVLAFAALPAVAAAHEGRTHVAEPFDLGATAELMALSAPPSGFVESTVFTGLVAPTSVAFARRRARFVAEKGGRIRSSTTLADRHRRVFADLSARTSTTVGPRTARDGAPPGVPASPYVYVLYTYDAPPGADRPGLERHACRRRRTTERCDRVTGRLSPPAAQRDDRREQVLITRLVPAVHEPLRSATSRSAPDGVLYVSGRRRRSFTSADYGQAVALTRAATRPRGRRRMTPPTARAARCAPGPAHARRPDPLKRHRCCGWTRTPARRCRTTRLVASARPRGPADRRIRPAQPVPDHHAAGHQRGLARRRRLERLGRGQPRALDPTAGVRNYGWPCYEGDGRRPVRHRTCSVRDPLPAPGAAAHSGPSSRIRTARTSSRARNCARGTSSLRRWRSTPAARSPPAYRGALFFATTRAAASG